MSNILYVIIVDDSNKETVCEKTQILAEYIVIYVCVSTGRGERERERERERRAS